MPASRPFAEPDDLRAVQALAQEVWRVAPALSESDLTVGELAWGTRQHVGREPEWRRRLWLDGGRVVAFAWLFLPGALAFQVHPDHGDLVDVVLDWFEQEAEGAALAVNVSAANERFAAALRSRGFSHDAAANWSLFNVRDLDEIEEPQPPPG